MNNSEFPNQTEDLQDFLAHPQYWPGTEVLLRLKDTETRSVLHYSPLIDSYFWRPLNDEFSVTNTRIAKGIELPTQLVQEGWVLEDA